MWELPSLFCPFNFSSHISSNFSGFNVNWMLLQIDHELQESRHVLSTISNETSMFLRPSSDSQPTRPRRGAGVGLAALAAVSTFGGGVAMGSSNSCGLRGIFGGCQDEAKANAENFRKLSEFPDVVTKFVADFSSETDENFFLVKKEIAALNAIQAEMSSTQNRNWVFIQEQFAACQQNFHILRDCS